MRAGIAEDETPEPALAKLRDALERVHPRRRRAQLGSSRASRTCSASPSGRAPDREDLFSAWRLFFERLADERARHARVRGPAVGRLGAARLRRVPARVVARATRSSCSRSRRPELAERRPGFGSARPEPDHALARAARPRRDGESCSTGFVPGLPDELRAPDPRAGRGRPAVRGRDRPDAARPRPARARGRRLPADRRIEALDVPETLHALVAARLDGLEPEERRILQDAAVLGKTFTKAASPRSPAWASPSSSRSSPRSCARRCCRSKPTRARPSAASTASSRIS